MIKYGFQKCLELLLAFFLAVKMSKRVAPLLSPPPALASESTKQQEVIFAEMGSPRVAKTGKRYRLESTKRQVRDD